MRSIARRVVPLSSILAVSMFLAGGCGITRAMIREIPEKEAASVRAGENTIVFLRLAPRIDNIPVVPVGEALGPDNPFILFMANIDRREEPKLFWSFYSSSDDAVNENWIYFSVPPGAHWVGILTPPYVKKDFYQFYFENSFYLKVPIGVPLLYAGTLSSSCTSKWGIFGRLLDRCDKVRIEDESDAAESVARRDFVRFGPMETVLLQHIRGGHVAKELEPLSPIGVTVSGSLPVLTPDWRIRGVYRAIGFGSDPGSACATFLTGGDPGVAFAYLLYLPFGTAGGLIGGSHSSRKWGPCMDNIVEHVRNWSPADVLGTELIAALSRRGVGNVSLLDNSYSVLREAGNPRFRSLIEVELQELEFRECQERWTFSADMKVRARLRDLDRNRTLYDGILVYSSPFGIPPVPRVTDRMPYERFADEYAPCRPIEEYCAPEGAKVYIGDLERATRFLAEQLLDEMGLGPHRSEENKNPVFSDDSSFPTSSIIQVPP